MNITQFDSANLEKLSRLYAKFLVGTKIRTTNEIHLSWENLIKLFVEGQAKELTFNWFKSQSSLFYYNS